MTPLLDRIYGPSIDPTNHSVVKLFPANPPAKREIVLVDGERCVVTRVRVEWEGARWTLTDLRVRKADQRRDTCVFGPMRGAA